MKLPSKDEKYGNYLLFNDFFYAGKTVKSLELENKPNNFETYRAYQLLAENIIDKVIEEFGGN